MNDESSKEVNAYFAYVAVAVASGIASVLIAGIAILNLNLISDSGMWAIAVMVLAPAIMAFGVCYFISVSRRTIRTEQNVPPAR